MTVSLCMDSWLSRPRRERAGSSSCTPKHYPLTISPAKETFSMSRISCPEVHQCLFITQIFVVVEILLYKSVSHDWGGRLHILHIV